VLHSGANDGAGYTYDNAGNRTSNYTYDPIYELTQVLRGATQTESYTYDPVGNRLSAQGVNPYQYDVSNRLTSAPSVTYGYDPNGSMTTKTSGANQTAYTWDIENRLSSVTLPSNGGTVGFRYDPLGRRIQKTLANGDAKNYLYDGANIIAELDSTGTVLASYTQGAGVDEPLAIRRGGLVAYYHADGLGSITSLTNVNAQTVASYTYDSFGNTTATEGIFNPYRYTGREQDPETGLYYYRARYYDPTIGRFISEDPFRFWGGIDFYKYVDNDPNDHKDSLGLCGDNCKDAAPALASSSACDAYGSEVYEGVSLKLFCECAGNGDWALQVRGCLACEHKNGTETGAAHRKCYAAAAQMPYNLVQQCLHSSCVGSGCDKWWSRYPFPPRLPGVSEDPK
jgi:RHS repeat-associated protein